MKREVVAWWVRWASSAWGATAGFAFLGAIVSAVSGLLPSLIFWVALWYFAVVSSNRAQARRDRAERERVIQILASLGWSHETLDLIRRKLQ